MGSAPALRLGEGGASDLVLAHEGRRQLHLQRDDRDREAPDGRVAADVPHAGAVGLHQRGGVRDREVGDLDVDALDRPAAHRPRGSVGHVGQQRLGVAAEERPRVAPGGCGGGELVQIQIARAEAVGGFLGFRPAMPVVQWRVRKP